MAEREKRLEQCLHWASAQPACIFSLTFLMLLLRRVLSVVNCLELAAALDFGTPKDSEGLGDLFNRSIPETEMNKTLL